MVTSTLIHNSQMVVVGIGSAPTTGPWLQQSTYLLDQFGHTTAVLPHQPTVVLTVTPTPYTAQVQNARPSTATSNRTTLPSTVTDGLPSGWEYKGCFVDKTDARVLPLRLPDDPELTAQECVSSCYQLGYSVAGLEYRRECFCGNAIYNGGTLAPWQTDCNMTCTGDAMQVCGALNRSSTYSNATLKVYQPEVMLGAQTSSTTMATPTTAPTIAPTIAPSRAGSISHTPKVNVNVAAGVVGVAGVAIMIALVYLCWRIRRNRRTKSPRQVSQNTAQAWSPAGPVPSWEDFLKATEGYYAKVDESNRFGLGPQSVHVEHHPTIPELREVYEWQLNNHQLHQAGSENHTEPPTRYSPTTRLALQGHLGQPTSILKRPSTPRIRDVAQGTFELEDREAPREVPATGNLARAKKGVRFGVNQIREFGRTPFIGSGSDSSMWSR